MSHAGPDLARGLAALVLVAALQPPIWARLGDGYAGDDFFHLGIRGGAGLAALSAALVALVVLSAAAITRRLPQTRPPLALLHETLWRSAVYLALLTLSPQVYYTYYQSVIAGLPRQWVLSLPDPEKLYASAAILPGARLAEHLSGTVYWAFLLAGILTLRLGWRVRAPLALLVCAMPAALRQFA